jgi:hypothetical protein
LGKVSSGFVTVYDDLLSDEWTERLYTYACAKDRPWGVYVTGKDARDSGLSSEALLEADPEKAMALEAVRALVYRRGAGTVGTDADERIHGTAIWCLASGESDQVNYHIDYAELYRYETNIIHPPLYAGTCHVSPLMAGEMAGGDFMVNTGGLEHYKRFGYKGALQPLQDDLVGNGDGDWLSIKYKRNRGILHDGDLPHLSTPVTKLATGKRRVILGFNCFSEAVSECCIRAPEHSDAFNRTVKIYQATSSGKLGNDGKARLSAKEVMKNPALAKLLVLAARKVKEEAARREAASSAASEVVGASP